MSFKALGCEEQGVLSALAVLLRAGRFGKLPPTAQGALQQLVTRAHSLSGLGMSTALACMNSPGELSQ
jgi:hypothetical protein